ncbi:molybdopterin-containing oxidoreductase family protein [Caldalkalibacillus salinus]|uniref:molybdopterin-containing oxidoreductase family protein n=1 Tax=Caldalkalibacillus salinus TaxID=2803787 RepID=UPI0019208482|nr:molybdopterin-dependent oxidoreductase [Caldalkalibacillus salinus]
MKQQEQQIPTMCINCSTVCGMIAHVKEGKVTKLEGNPKDPNSRGKLCAKGHAAINMLYDPHRILHPLRRVGKRGEGQWERITWQEAIDEVADRLREVKRRHPEKLVLQYGRDRTNGLLERFTNAFGTPNKVGHRGLCSLNKRMAIKAAIGDTDWDTNDVAHTSFMLNFGSNLYEAHQGHVPFLQRVVEGKLKKQATLVTFDVRLSHTAAQSDEWHPIFPGTDGLVALAMGNVIMQEGLYDEAFIEKWTTTSVQALKDHLSQFTPQWAEAESGVPAETIVRLAKAFAEAAPQCTTISNRGTHAHRNGFYNESAVTLLNAIVGSVGQKGGWCYTSSKPDSSAYPPPVPMPPKPQKQTELSHPSAFPLANALYPGAVSSTIYPYIAEGKVDVEALITYYVNAPMSWPEGETTVQDVYLDESLVPFHVAIDAFYSESAHLADLILPDATFLEKWDLDTRNSYELTPYIGLRQPVVPPQGESRDIRDIMKDIALAIGEGMAAYFAYDSAADYVQRWAVNVPGGWETLKQEGIHWHNEATPNYEPYKRKLTKEALQGTYVEDGTDIIRREDGTAIGIMVDGQPYRGFQTPTRKFTIYNPMIDELNRTHGTSYSPWPTYVPLDHQELADDQFVLTTFKWNVHTQSRTMNQKWLAEIVHDNPMWLHPKSALAIGIEDGDDVTLHLPDGEQYLEVKAFITEGIHPKVVAISASMGHTAYGPVASGQGLPRSVLQAHTSKRQDNGRAQADTSEQQNGGEARADILERENGGRVRANILEQQNDSGLRVDTLELRNGSGAQADTLERQNSSRARADIHERQNGGQKQQEQRENQEQRWWTTTGYNPNAIIRSDADPVGGGQAWNDTVVSIRKGEE